MNLERVVSGGQTGADRAALDWAMAHAIPHGGWCPRVRRAEDGPISKRYALLETPSGGYEQRTRWNVRDSDGTLILARATVLTGGSAFTARVARQSGRPWLHVHSMEQAEGIRSWLLRHGIRVLNVAGPRTSTDPQAYVFAMRILEALREKA